MTTKQVLYVLLERMTLTSLLQSYLSRIKFATIKYGEWNYESSWGWKLEHSIQNPVLSLGLPQFKAEKNGFTYQHSSLAVA